MFIKIIKKSLRGSFEIAVFLRQGVERFEPSVRFFWLSFLVPAFLLLPNVLLALKEPEFQGISLLGVVVIIAYRTLISTAIFLASVWALSWPLDRVANFWRFGAIYNWLGVPSLLLMLPYFILSQLQVLAPKELGDLLLFLIGLWMGIVAFAAKHALAVNWVIAVGVSVLSMACLFLAASMLY